MHDGYCQVIVDLAPEMLSFIDAAAIAPQQLCLIIFDDSLELVHRCDYVELLASGRQWHAATTVQLAFRSSNCHLHF